MEWANYAGDPGGYDKRVFNVMSWQACQQECAKDPECCHWTLYGSMHPNKKPGHGPNTCWLKAEMSFKVVRMVGWITRGPVQSGSKVCSGQGAMPPMGLGD